MQSDGKAIMKCKLGKYWASCVVRTTVMLDLGKMCI